MSRTAFLLTLALLASGAARAQVQVTPLAAPDAFSTPGRDTGLPPDLWRGAPVELVRAVLPLMATRALSPAALDLARQVLATGASGPDGSRGDESLLGARANALIVLGDLGAAAAVLDRAAGLERNAALAQAAAEVALLSENPTRACAIADAVATGRTETYWLRLRAFCHAQAGEVAKAQLTLDLAQAQARDVVFGRLMAARLSGAAPGAASARNGLDLALSRALKLDFAGVKAASAAAEALGFKAATPRPSSAELDRPLEDLLVAAEAADAKGRARSQAVALLAAGLRDDLSGADRVRLAGFAVAEGKGPVGRSLALDQAAREHQAGATALLALWICADAGAAGPALGDRVRIVAALARAGLADAARWFAAEGVAGLK